MVQTINALGGEKQKRSFFYLEGEKQKGIKIIGENFTVKFDVDSENIYIWKESSRLPFKEAARRKTWKQNVRL